MGFSDLTPGNEITGATDDTLIGNVGDRLKVETTLVSNPGGSPGGPVTSSKMRILQDQTEITITSSNTTLYSYSGSGKFFGFSSEFDSQDLYVKLTIDGEVVYDLIFKELDNHLKYGPNSKEAGRDFQDNGDRFQYYPPHPIAYTTSILIESRVTGGNKKSKDRLVFLTKET